MADTDTAVLDAPTDVDADAQQQSQPQQPLRAPLAPGLQALIESALPMPSDGDEGERRKAEGGKEEADTDAQPVKEKKAATQKRRAAAATVPGLAPDFDESPAGEKTLDAAEAPKTEEPPPELANKTWVKNFRAEHDRLKADYAALQEKVSVEPKADPALLSQLEAVQKENQQLRATVERRAIEEHPEFARQITQPLSRAYGEAHEILRDAKMDPAQFNKAMRLTGSERFDALEAIYEGMPESAKAELASSVRDIKHLEQRREAALRDAKGTSERLKNEDTINRHKNIEAQRKQLDGLLSAARTELADNLGLEVLQKTDKPGFEWWNEQRETIIKNANEILFNGGPEEIAMAANLAAVAGPYRSLYLSERKERKALQARLSEYEDTEPDLSSGRGPKVETPKEFAPDADLVEVAMERLRRGDFKK